MAEFECAASQIPILEILKLHNQFEVSEMSPAKETTSIGLIQGLSKLSGA